MIPGPLDQRTGGYIYDRRMVEGLRTRGWAITVHSLAGVFPAGDHQAREALSATLASLPDGARVVLDGLAMGALPDLLRPHAGRLRLVSLVHHPLADETGLDVEAQGRFRELERAALALCRGVIVTSAGTATRIVDGYGVDGSRVRSVPPGVDPAPPSPGSPPGSPTRLLCVASVTRRKGHDVLVAALARVAASNWECICVGSLQRDPAFAAEVQGAAHGAELNGRVVFTGECDDERLEEVYRSADVFVLPSHYEGYGMVLTEALARGIPVVSTTGGAIPGTVPEGAGLLVPPGDAAALAAALDTLLGTDGHDDIPPARQALARRAREVSRSLPDWDTTTNAFAGALMELTPDEAHEPSPAATFAADWLAVREPVDHRSRSAELTVALRSTWSDRGWTRVLDLGSGTGSNLRHLGRALPGIQHWTLLDHDAGLLERAVAPGPDVHLRRITGDLTREGLDEVAQADVVTASALLDLVSDEWLQHLVARCAHRRCGVLLALSYDGQVSWNAPDTPDGVVDADRLVQQAVNAHQHRNKGVGRALGPDAAPRAAELFRRAGFTVTLAPSPWVLGPGDEELVARLVDGWARAAQEERPGDADLIERWAGRRREPGAPWGLTVGHVDLLALPHPPA